MNSLNDFKKENLSTNPKVNVFNQNGQLIANYNPDESDILNSTYDLEEYKKYTTFQKPINSLFNFFASWVVNKFVLVALAVFSITALMQGSDNGIIKWLGDNVLGSTLNLVLYTNKNNQNITVAMGIFIGYLSYFLFTQLLSIPHELREQRQDEILKVQLEALRRSQEYRNEKYRNILHENNLVKGLGEAMIERVKTVKNIQKGLDSIYPNIKDMDFAQLSFFLSTKLKERRENFNDSNIFNNN